MMRIFWSGIICLIMCLDVSIAQTNQTVQLECGHDNLDIVLPEGFTEIPVTPDNYGGCYFGYFYSGEDTTLQGSTVMVMWCHNCSVSFSRQCEIVTKKEYFLYDGDLYLCDSPTNEQTGDRYYVYQFALGAYHISFSFPIKSLDIFISLINQVKHW